MEPTPRRIEGNFSQGWPTAIFITLLAVGAFVTAGVIHNRTYRHPRDVTADYQKDGAEHGAPAKGTAPAH